MLPIATQFNSFLRFLLLDPKFELLVVVCRVLHVSRGKGGALISCLLKTTQLRLVCLLPSDSSMSVLCMYVVGTLLCIIMRVLKNVLKRFGHLAEIIHCPFVKNMC